jgi:peptide-methionine (S)-S-oxide reductase
MIRKATFAAGCFWGVEELFRTLKGVISTKVGYIGGNCENPTYEQVCADKTGHAEAVEILYDSEIVEYENLLKIFWENHNPTTKNRQGPDVGTQYRSAVFYEDEEQRDIAEKMKKELDSSGKFQNPVVTEIVPSTTFYEAEDYHQKYLFKKGRKSCSM